MAASEGLPRRRVQLDVIDRAAAGSRRRFIAFSPTEFAVQVSHRGCEDQDSIWIAYLGRVDRNRRPDR